MIGRKARLMFFYTLHAASVPPTASVAVAVATAL